MSFNIEELFADAKKEQEGVWVDFYAGSRLKIASTEAKEYKAELANQARKHKLQLDSDNKDFFDLITELTCEALSKHVLKGWEGINIGDQENVPYTPAVGKEMLQKSAPLRAFVEEAAGDHKTFREQVVEEVKNS